MGVSPFCIQSKITFDRSSVRSCKKTCRIYGNRLISLDSAHDTKVDCHIYIWFASWSVEIEYAYFTQIQNNGGEQ